MQAIRNGDANAVREAFAEVEKNRAQWCVNSIRFGLAALAAKAVVGHGNFCKWLSAALSVDGNARIMHERTAREYIGFAAVYVKKLRELKSPAIVEGVRLYCLINFGDEDALENFDVDTVLADAGKTYDLLKGTFLNMTPTSMRQLLREGAERAYADEEAEKAGAKKKSVLRGLEGESKSQDPQMLLWEDWTNEFENIEKLIRHNQAARLDPEKWLAIENTLEAQLEEIRKITAGFKAGLAKKRK